MAVYSFFDAFTELYSRFIKEFNEYSIKENLDIHLEMTLFSIVNTTEFMRDYPATIDYILNRKNKKYDLFVFDPIYTKKYSPFLTVIDDWLPEYIEWYSEGASEQTSKYKGHWYSLVCNLNYIKK